MLSNSSVLRYCNADGTGAVLSVTVESTLGTYEATLYGVSPGGANTGTVQAIAGVPSGDHCYFKAVPPGRYGIMVQDAPGNAVGSFLFVGPDAGGGAFYMTDCAASYNAVQFANAGSYALAWHSSGNLALEFTSVPAVGYVTSVRLLPGNLFGGLTGNYLSGIYYTTGTFASLPPAAYSFVAIADATILFGTVQALVLGCTDPLAANYNPLATAPDPAAPCEAWPARPDIFSIPACQSLSFVPGAPADACGTYPDPAAVLFNTAPRNRQETDYFAQRVATCDVLPIQVWSTWEENRIVLLNGAGAAVASFAGVKRITYRALTASVTGLTLTADPAAAARTLVSGAWTVLPPWAIVGATAAVTGTASQDGTYRIVAVDPWARTVALRLALNGAPVTGAALFVTYDAAPYDVYEIAVDFGAVPAGCYTLRAEGYLDPDNPAPAQWAGEPVEVGAAWPDTHRLDFTNRDRAFGVDYATQIVHRRRVPAVLHEGGVGGKQEAMRDGTNALVALGGFVTDTVKWQTAWVPPYLSRVLARAFAHDGIWVDGVEIRTEERYRVTGEKGYALENGDIVLERAVGVDTNRTDAGAVLPTPGAGGTVEYNSVEYA